MEGTSDVYTLSNHGRRVNCSVTTLFPATVSLVGLGILSIFKQFYKTCIHFSPFVALRGRGHGARGAAAVPAGVRGARDHGRDAGHAWGGAAGAAEPVQVARGGAVGPGREGVQLPVRQRCHENVLGAQALAAAGHRDRRELLQQTEASRRPRLQPPHGLEEKLGGAAGPAHLGPGGGFRGGAAAGGRGHPGSVLAAERAGAAVAGLLRGHQRPQREHGEVRLVLPGRRHAVQYLQHLLNAYVLANGLLDQAGRVHFSCLCKANHHILLREVTRPEKVWFACADVGTMCVGWPAVEAGRCGKRLGS